MTSPCWFSGVSWVFLLHTLSPRNWNYIQKNNMHVNKESDKLDSWKNGVKISWYCPFKHMFFAPILVILFKSWIFISSIYCTLSKCHHLFLVAKMFEQYSCGGVFSTVCLFLAYIPCFRNHLLVGRTETLFGKGKRPFSLPTTQPLQHHHHGARIWRRHK